MSFARFYDSDILSDLKIVFGDRQIFVHRIVLCSQSKWFAKALEGSFVEATSTSIELHDDDFSGLEDMIRCIYGIEVFPPFNAASDIQAAYERLHHLIKVYIKADKYAVDDLRPSLIMKFNDVADAVWNTEFFAAGHMSKLLQLVYTELPSTDPLRQGITAKMADNLTDYHEADAAALFSLFETLPDLGTGICLSLARRPKGMRMKPHKTALHWAAQCGDLEQCQRLVNEGFFEVDVQNEDGETPLHFATWHGKVDVTRFLVEKGANVHNASAAYPDGTPLSWARTRGHADVVMVLEAAGATA